MSYTLLQQIAMSVPGVALRRNVDEYIKDNTTDSVKRLIYFAFLSRDRRTPVGQRDLFRDILAHLSRTHYELVVALLEHIPQYGYWGDVFWLAMNVPTLFHPVLNLSMYQLKKDEIILAEGGSPSLFAKWVPKQGKKYHVFAQWLAKMLYPELIYSERMAIYRRRISRLNRSLNTVETLQCANRWDEIIPSQVPKVCFRKNFAAFINSHPHTWHLKDATDEKRMACRDHFMKYVNTPRSLPLFMLGEYEPLERVVDTWAEGGWRTT